MTKYMMIAAALGLVACGDTVQTSPPANDTAIDPPITIDASADELETNAEQVKASMNPLENDLRGLEIAVRLHEAFRIKSDRANFELGVNDPQGITRADEIFDLVKTTGIETDALKAAEKPGFYIKTFKLAEADHERMQATEKILMELREAAPGQNELKFNAYAVTCVEPGITPPDTYRYMVMVRSSPLVDFVTLASEVSIERGGTGVPEELWSECET